MEHSLAVELPFHRMKLLPAGIGPASASAHAVSGGRTHRRDLVGSDQSISSEDPNGTKRAQDPESPRARKRALTSTRSAPSLKLRDDDHGSGTPGQPIQVEPESHTTEAGRGRAFGERLVGGYACGKLGRGSTSHCRSRRRVERSGRSSDPGKMYPLARDRGLSGRRRGFNGASDPRSTA